MPDNSYDQAINGFLEDEEPIIEIELREHIGTRMIEGIPISHSMRQWYVMIGGSHGGWMGMDPGSFPILFVGFGDENNEKIRKKIEELVGWEVKKISVINRPGTDEEEARLQRVSLGDAQDDDDYDDF
jgi:hypothetical protein